MVSVNPYAYRAPPPGTPQPEPVAQAPTPPPSILQRIRVAIVSIGATLWLGVKFLAPALKLFPFLKTGVTMVLSIWVYAWFWGWSYAIGFVLLILVHECGHLIMARYMGLRVGAPVFIPFLGAAIALKDAPRNAWIEAVVGLGGPLFGAFGALICLMIGLQDNSGLFLALGYSGFLLNLFNLIPLGQLDGGRIVTAISPWLWVAGVAIVAYLVVFQGVNFILIAILILGLIRLVGLFRPKSAEERRYFEVTAAQRALIATLYFALAGALALGMEYTHPLIHTSRPIHSSEQPLL
jgi:Zn-dependent protease